MAGNTTKYVIPYVSMADAVASIATVMQNLANRVDLLLGESGQYNIASVAAATTHSQVITLARTYPGSNVGTPPGIVIVNLPGTATSALAWNFWITAWAGSASTITGFQLNTSWSSAQTNRVVSWRYLPVL